MRPDAPRLDMQNAGKMSADQAQIMGQNWQMALREFVVPFAGEPTCGFGAISRG